MALLAFRPLVLELAAVVTAASELSASYSISQLSNSSVQVNRELVSFGRKMNDMGERAQVLGERLIGEVETALDTAPPQQFRRRPTLPPIPPPPQRPEQAGASVFASEQVYSEHDMSEV